MSPMRRSARRLLTPGDDVDIPGAFLGGFSRADPVGRQWPSEKYARFCSTVLMHCLSYKRLLLRNGFANSPVERQLSAMAPGRGLKFMLRAHNRIIPLPTK